MSFYNRLDSEFKEFYNETPVILSVKTANNELITITDFTQNYAFFGNFGTGKTCTAIQFARKYKELLLANDYEESYLDYQMRFITLADYHELCCKTIKSDEAEKEVKIIRQCKFLILDDISLSSWSDAKIDNFESLLKYRKQNRLQTIFTSNKGYKALEQDIPAICDRIIEMVGHDNSILFQTNSYRVQSKTGQKTELQLQIEALEAKKTQVVTIEAPTSQIEDKQVKKTPILEVTAFSNYQDEVTEEIDEEEIAMDSKYKSLLADEDLALAKLFEFKNSNQFVSVKVTKLIQEANQKSIKVLDLLQTNQALNGMFKGYLSKFLTQ